MCTSTAGNVASFATRLLRVSAQSAVSAELTASATTMRPSAACCAPTAANAMDSVTRVSTTHAVEWCAAIHATRLRTARASAAYADIRTLATQQPVSAVRCALQTPTVGQQTAAAHARIASVIDARTLHPHRKETGIAHYM